MTVEHDRTPDLTRVLPAVLRRAAVRATLAASVRNSQPWRLVLHPDRLVVRADRSRRLPVFDPTGRQLLLSCGAAVFNARVALAAAGIGDEVTWGPDALGTGDVDDLAMLRPAPDITDPDLVLAGLDWATLRRRSSWGPFTTPAEPALVAALVAAARAEGADLVAMDPAAAARAARVAAVVLDADAAYLAELRAWRAGATWIPDDLDWRTSTCLVLSTPTDSPAAWLRAGEALQRVLLTATALDTAAHVLSLPIEVPAARHMVEVAAGCPGYAHLVVRVGCAPAAPASARRRLVDVIRTVGAGT
ncbi:hypothetical protein [Sporichthya polymorpha]|uniref:hypothetical protein n=1 Tax=Sporichthya polymorpha TaxID=35751 RepID=UPI000377949C|nr:hypothetical protein [Sporichthya polymorpha]